MPTGKLDVHVEGELGEGYAGLKHGNVVILYRPSDGIVNATQLLKSGGKPRRALDRYFARNPSVTKWIRKGQNAIAQGTYISFEDAIVLCTDFELDPGLIQRLVEVKETIGRGESANYGASSDVVCHNSDLEPGAGSVAEPSYEKGSYLAPAGHSHLQPFDPQRCLTLSPAACPDIWNGSEEGDQGGFIQGWDAVQGTNPFVKQEEYVAEREASADVFNEFRDQVNNKPFIAAALVRTIEDGPGFARPSPSPHQPPNCSDGAEEQANGNDRAGINVLPNTQPPQAGNHLETSHLNTRDLLFDREGLVYMVIRRHAVSIRTFNFHLNASQILTAAKVKKWRRDHYLRTLKKRGVLNRATRYSHAWVPFKDGASLCQVVGLDSELQPLLSHAKLAMEGKGGSIRYGVSIGLT